MGEVAQEVFRSVLLEEGVEMKYPEVKHIEEVEMSDAMREEFDIADSVIEQAYPNIYGLEKGMWGHQRIQNYGILRGAIASAIAQERIESQKREAELQAEIARLTELGRKNLGRAIVAENELAKYKEAKPYGWFDVECGQMFFYTHERKPETEIPLYAHHDNAKE